MDRPAGIYLFVLMIILGNIFLLSAQESCGEFQVFPKISWKGEQKPLLLQDRFIAPDKAQHFIGSLIFSKG